jgi:hypothetical protein
VSRRATRTVEVPAWLALGLVLALAVAGRAWEAARTPLWFDEIFTLRVARLPVPDLVRALAADMHPPLHFLLVHAWIALPPGEAWVELPGVAIGAATVAATFGFARALAGGNVALLAALLLALHRHHVYFSQEVRSYALLWLWYVLAAWMAWRWVRDGRPRDAALYVATAAAALWTHYQAGFVLAFLGLWGVLALARAPRRLAAWAGLHLAVALLFAPQVPTFLAQWHRLGADHWLRPPTAAAFLEVLRRWSFHVAGLVPVLAGLTLLPFVDRDLRRGAAMLWLAFLLPVAVAFALSVLGARLFLDRYMMFALPAWCVLAAAGVAVLRPRGLRPLVAAALLAVAALTLVRHPVHVEAASLAHAREWLEARVRAGDLVVAGDTHSLYFLEEHAPALGRKRLLLSGPRLPYYEGALFVPDSVRVRPEAWDSLVAGARWFGVRTRHGGIDSRPALERMLGAARGEVAGFGQVTVVSGQAE